MPDPTQNPDLAEVFADAPIGGLSGYTPAAVGPPAMAQGVAPSLARDLNANTPAVPTPLSSLGDYFENAGQLYAHAVGKPSFRDAMVNDPTYKLTKGYLDNASRVFGGNGVNDNTYTDPQTGKVYLGSQPPPKEPAPVAPGGEKGPLVFPAADAGGNAARTPQIVNVKAAELAKVSPERQAAMAAANEAEQQAVEGERGGAAAQGEAEANAADVLAKGKGEESEKEKRQSEDAKAAAFNRLELHNRMLTQMAKRQIDPMHYMNSRDTGQKVIDAIGGLFGGLASGGHGPNQYVEHMHGLVREDIQAQQANMDHEDNLYKEAYRVTGDHAEATRLAEVMALKSVQDKTAAAVAGVQNPIILAKAAQATALLEQKRAQLAGKGVEEGIHMNAYIPAHQTVVGGPSPMSDEDEKKLVTMPDGRQVLAPSEKGAEEMRKTIEAHTSIKSLVDEARQLRQSHLAGIPGTFAHNRLEAIGNELVLKTREPGVRLGEQEMGILRTMQGDITSSAKHVIGQDTTDANLEHLGTAATTNLQTFAGSQRLPTVRTGYGIDPTTGRPVRTSQLVGADYTAPPKKKGGAAPAGFVPVK